MRLRWLLPLAILLCMGAAPAAADEPATGICAVCAAEGGPLAPEPVAATADYEGQRYVFCKGACRDTFLKSPADWARRFHELMRDAVTPKPYGTLAPWSLRLSDGSTVSSESMRNRLLVINFWASWCASCVEEIPAFTALQSRREKDGLRVLGVSYDRTEAPHAEAIKKHGLNYPSVLASTPEAKRLIADVSKIVGPIESIPLTVIVDGSGTVVFRRFGVVSEAELEKVLAQLTAPASSAPAP